MPRRKRQTKVSAQFATFEIQLTRCFSDRCQDEQHAAITRGMRVLNTTALNQNWSTGVSGKTQAVLEMRKNLCYVAHKTGYQA